MYAPASEYVPQCAPGSRARGGALFAWLVLSLVALDVLGLALAAPILLAHGFAGPAGLIYKAFSFLCHQLPSRSFHLEGHPLGVCARCTGIYAGFAASALLYPLVRSLNSSQAPRRFWLLLACLPIALDFALGFFGIWPNTHFSRFATGAIFGAACALFVTPGVLDIGRAVERAILRRQES